jgi:hypothetical protein
MVYEKLKNVRRIIHPDDGVVWCSEDIVVYSFIVLEGDFFCMEIRRNGSE